MNIDNWSYGYEVEWGDINRKLKVPSHLGSWEIAETDILNLKEPNKYIACDPLGIKPCFGGEINTTPNINYNDQVNKILELYKFFKENGSDPTTSCINHGHVHIHIPGLIENTNLLKKLIIYIKKNQKITVDACYKFYSQPIMKKLKGCTAYLKLDGGRLMPDFMCDNIINKSENFQHFIKLHSAGKDAISLGRPFRYAINTYCLKHTKTVEFRCFRATIKKKELEDQFKFVTKFMSHALTDHKPVFKILQEYEYDFPPFNFSAKEYVGWLNTKYDKSRGEKKRKFISV